jgi:SRSO17 transposase
VTLHRRLISLAHAPWSAERVWRQLRAIIPERSGVLVLDGTSFPKQGRRSVAVARQYCGTLGRSPTSKRR